VVGRLERLRCLALECCPALGDGIVDALLCLRDLEKLSLRNCDSMPDTAALSKLAQLRQGQPQGRGRAPGFSFEVLGF
jgi:hypothetical protein